MTKEESDLIRKIDKLIYKTKVYCYDDTLYKNKYNEYVYLSLLYRSYAIGNRQYFTCDNEFIRETINSISKIKDRRVVINNIDNLCTLKIIKKEDEEKKEYCICQKGNQFLYISNYILLYICNNYTNPYLIKILLFLSCKYNQFNINSNKDFVFSIRVLIEDCLRLSTTRNKLIYEKIKEALKILSDDGFISFEEDFVSYDSNVRCIKVMKLKHVNLFDKNKLYSYITEDEYKKYLKYKDKQNEERKKLALDF